MSVLECETRDGESQGTNENEELMRAVYLKKEKISERQNLQKSNSRRRLRVQSHYCDS